MNTIAWNKINETIKLYLNGRLIDVTKDHPRYDQILEACYKNTYDGIEALIESKLEAMIRTLGNPHVKIKEGRVVVFDSNLPDDLHDRLVSFLEQGICVDPLVNLWDRIRNNVSYSVRTQLYKFLSHNDVLLMSDGRFVAYKSVTSDFKDFRTRTFDNSPGKEVTMPRNMVDDNPDQTCSDGLHVASWTYAVGFCSGGDRKLIACIVDPADVVSVPTDYNGTKMRCCRYIVDAEVIDPIGDRLVYDDVSDDDSEGGDLHDLDDLESHLTDDELSLISLKDNLPEMSFHFKFANGHEVNTLDNLFQYVKTSYDDISGDDLIHLIYALNTQCDVEIIQKYIYNSDLLLRAIQHIADNRS